MLLCGGAHPLTLTARTCQETFPNGNSSSNQIEAILKYQMKFVWCRNHAVCTIHIRPWEEVHRPSHPIHLDRLPSIVSTQHLRCFFPIILDLKKTSCSNFPRETAELRFIVVSGMTLFNMLIGPILSGRWDFNPGLNDASVGRHTSHSLSLAKLFSSWHADHTSAGSVRTTHWRHPKKDGLYKE